ncbi:MAG: dethiobiotin synthase [Saprospiraceae bacterium]|nr:dethiobiotin synthase [Saprospiraceae bacterium]MDW8484627.1 AAA family ATPase [Saprospiraceae bacterium]
MQHRLYVAATNQHVGKTTCTLGITSALLERGYRVGYCKPVGQQYIRLEEDMADKDALLFAQVLNFPLKPAVHSPVILGDGATQAFWDAPGEFAFNQRLLRAGQHFTAEKFDWVVFEGTGHPGVGSIVGLSNAVVARLLNARVILIIRGGIGRTIDEMALALALFGQEGIPIEGVIVNKVLPDKIEKIRHYLGKVLGAWGIPLLGVIPYDESMMFPLFEQIRKAVGGRTVFHPEKMENRIATIVSGSLVESYDLKVHRNILIVSNSLRLPEVLRKMTRMAQTQGISHPDVAGILVTGADDGHPPIQNDPLCRDFILQHHIPVVECALDAYGAALRISALEVKINTRTPWKVKRATELIREYVDIDQLVAIMNTRPKK